MSNYFRNFGIVTYRFGNGLDPVLFNDLTAYVDLIDQIIENVSFYNKYTIQAGERPDTLSYKLYGTTDYYWTFFLLNDHVRLSGWPIASYDILSEAKKKYPFRMVTTNTNLTNIFPIGQTVRGVISGTSGTIIRKIPDLGQLVIDTGEEPNTTAFSANELLTYTDVEGNLQTLQTIAESEQYNAVHHYEDADGVIQDVTLFDFGNPSSLLTPITYRNRIEKRNDSLKEIIVLKPDVVAKVAGEFFKFHQQES